MKHNEKVDLEKLKKFWSLMKNKVEQILKYFELVLNRG